MEKIKEFLMAIVELITLCLVLAFILFILFLIGKVLFKVAWFIIEW